MLLPRRARRERDASLPLLRQLENAFGLQAGASEILFPGRVTNLFASSTEIAKFRPSLPGDLKLFTPIKVPESLISGPPELPGLIGV